MLYCYMFFYRLFILVCTFWVNDKKCQRIYRSFSYQPNYLQKLNLPKTNIIVLKTFPLIQSSPPHARLTIFWSSSNGNFLIIQNNDKRHSYNIKKSGRVSIEKEKKTSRLPLSHHRREWFPFSSKLATKTSTFHSSQKLPWTYFTNILPIILILILDK